MAPKRKRKGKSLDPPSEEINLSNQFDLLTDDENDPSSSQNANKHSRLNAKKEKVPPIVVTTSDFHALRKAILNFVKGFKFSLQIGRRGECRLLAETLDGFNRLLEFLTQRKYKFFTYDTKTERLFKVVLKGLASGESLVEIKNELTKLLGIEPVQVIKMKMKSRPGDSRKGISNDFYLVHFKSSELNNLKALEKANLMLHVRVKWEHFRKTGENFHLTQCRKCQGWGHGTRNCYMNAKCMNCGASSHTKDSCPVKDDPKKYKCSNCGGNHKSNFWECKTRKAILQSRTKHQVGNALLSQPGTSSSAVNNGQRGTNSTFVPAGTNRSQASNSRSGTYASAVNNGQRGRNATFVPAGTSNVQASNSPFVPAANNVQQANGATSATASAGRGHNPNSNGNCDDFDLGSITAPKMEFLQQSLIDMITEMLKTNSMFDAIQTGLKFANNIVMTLKFSNGY